MKIELSATGHDCKIKVRSEGDTHHIAQAFMSSMLDIIE